MHLTIQGRAGQTALGPALSATIRLHEGLTDSTWITLKHPTRQRDNLLTTVSKDRRNTWYLDRMKNAGVVENASCNHMKQSSARDVFIVERCLGCGVKPKAHLDVLGVALWTILHHGRAPLELGLASITQRCHAVFELDSGPSCNPVQQRVIA